MEARIALVVSNPYRIDVDKMEVYPVSKLLSEYDGVLKVHLSAAPAFSWFPDAKNHFACVFKLGDEVSTQVFALTVPPSLVGKEMAAIVPTDEAAAAFISQHGIGARDAYFLTPQFHAAVAICHDLMQS